MGPRLRAFIALLFYLSTCPAFCESKIIYLSDVDDTIIQTNIAKRVALVRDVIRKRKKPAFMGMSLLFSEILKNNPRIEFQYLSGTPEMMRHQLTQKLKGYGFPTGQMTLRHWIPVVSDVTYGLIGDTIFSTRRYKYHKLRAIFSANPDTKFILFGDDVEFDPELYLKIAGEFPDQVEQIYIRKIKGRLKEDFGIPLVVQFSTEVDIALNELFQHRLSEQSMITFGQSMLTLAREHPELVFAEYAKKYKTLRFPTHLSLSVPLRDLMNELERAYQATASSLQALCAPLLGPPKVEKEPPEH